MSLERVMSQGSLLTLNLCESQKISRMLSHNEVQSRFKGIKSCGNFLQMFANWLHCLLFL